MNATLSITGDDLTKALEEALRKGLTEESGKEWMFDWEEAQFTQGADKKWTITVPANYSEIF